MARAIGKRAGWREKVCVEDQAGDRQEEAARQPGRQPGKSRSASNSMPGVGCGGRLSLALNCVANRMETHRRLPSSSRQRKSAKSVLTVARVPLQRSKTS
ncbi:hypothetical protein HZH68_004748 [Vespula germanica]|uniref:Uncharacterized protein n=1 Tax=Vespula germanica TaxID=30212 RepID=A0A834KQT4_VESGE|nr:hypothetical protein HZH68_004748 [Vespula germanica]